MEPDESRPETDEALLDRVFADLVEAVSDGKEFSVVDLLAERPDLAPQVEELRALASQVAVRRPATTPSFPGYEILGKIGQGGMGSVFLARQQRPDRLVALKTLTTRTLSGESARARFEREVHSIARLDHANIVSVHEMGELEGVPYFTMEYVRGMSLDAVVGRLREAGEGALKLKGSALAEAVWEEAPARLPESWQRGWQDVACRMVIEVAYALQHAHDHQVIHRDVKPSNVLLRRDGKALLFDFGLAKDDADVELTLSGDYVGSPFYMAPEQADRRHGQIDSRSDVYSLGVTLYELLTLKVPFEGVTTQEILSNILRKEPPPLRRHAGSISRDLEAICLTAMDKDASRRYPTAAHFAEDLERFLAFEPIRARPAGTITRTVRFVQRNRALSASLVLGFLLMVGIPLGMLFQERQRLETEKQLREKDKKLLEQEKEYTRELQAKIRKVNAINDYQLSLFESIDPRRDGRDVTVAVVLARAIESLADAYLDEPDIGVALRNLIGQTCGRLEMREEAAEILRSSMEIAREELPPDDPDRIVAIEEFGRALYFLQDYENAEEHLREALATRIENGDTRSEDALFVMSSLAAVLTQTGQRDEGRVLLVDALDIAREQYGDESLFTLERLLELSREHLRSGDYASASETIEECRVLLREKGFGSEEHLLGYLSIAADLHYLRQEFDLAEAHYQELADLGRERHGEDSPVVLVGLTGLAGVLSAAGKLDEAEAQFEALLEIRMRLNGPRHRDTLILINNFCVNLHRQRDTPGKLERARELLSDAITEVTALHGENHPNVLGFRATLAANYAYAEDYDEAARRQLDITERRVEVLGLHVQETVNSRYVTGRFYELGERYAEAAEQFRMVAETAEEAGLGVKLPRYEAKVGVCLVAAGQVEEGRDWLRRAIAGLEAQQVPETDTELVLARTTLAESLAGGEPSGQ